MTSLIDKANLLLARKKNLNTELKEIEAQLSPCYEEFMSEHLDEVDAHLADCINEENSSCLDINLDGELHFKRMVRMNVSVINSCELWKIITDNNLESSFKITIDTQDYRSLTDFQKELLQDYLDATFKPFKPFCVPSKGIKHGN